MRRLYAQRDARLYIAGQLLSSIGDFALWLAMAFQVKILTGSASAASLTFFMLALGSLAGPVGGVLADRLRRRPVLIATNLATAALILLLLPVHKPDQVWLIYLVMFCYGLSSAVTGPAGGALLKTVVPPELLADANGLMSTVGQGMRLVVPLVGAAVLVAFGSAPLILGDAASFLAATATLLAIDVREERPAPSERHWLSEATAGARHIGRSRDLRRLTLAGIAAIITFGLAETAVFAVVGNGLHRPVSFVAITVSAQGVGAIIAGLTAAPLVRRIGEGGVVGLGLTSAACAYLLLAVPSAPVVLVGPALLGASLSWITVGTTTLLQRRTPSDLMGRTSAAFDLLLTVPQTIAIALGAALFAAFDYRLLLAAMAALVAFSAAYLFMRRAEGEQRRTSDAAEAHLDAGPEETA
jgi:MFS family permease